MRRMLITLSVMALAALSQAESVRIAWNAPTNSTDGLPLDPAMIAGYRFSYAEAAVTYTATTGGVVTVQAWTNVLPWKEVWTTNTLVTLPALAYRIWACHVSCVTVLGDESGQSSNLLFTVGTPATIQLRRL